MENEIWESVPGYEGDYQVSNHGLVKSLKYGRERLLNQEINKGYLRVTFSKNNKQHRFLVHVLVARLFCSGWWCGKEVHHKDFNRQNNYFSNLEWVTRSENEKYTHSAGRKRPPESKRVRNTTTGFVYDSISEAAKANGYKMKTLSAMLSGQNSNHSKLVTV